MTRKAKFEPGHGYTKEDWDAVSDNPEWTAEEIAQAKPFAEVFPHLAEAVAKNKGGRPKLEKPKAQVTLRIDQEVIDRFKSDGPGWQSRINEALRKAAHLDIGDA